MTPEKPAPYPGGFFCSEFVKPFLAGGVPLIMDNNDNAICKVCGDAPAVLPVGVPDMCADCNAAAWARIAARNANRPGTPANDVTNVWD